MEENQIIQQTASLVNITFELPDQGNMQDEEALVQILARRIDEMLERQPEQLMSLLYRLDVLERKILPVMRPDAIEPAHIGLARLVIDRQK